MKISLSKSSLLPIVIGLLFLISGSSILGQSTNGYVYGSFTYKDISKKAGKKNYSPAILKSGYYSSISEQLDHFFLYHESAGTKGIGIDVNISLNKKGEITDLIFLDTTKLISSERSIIKSKVYQIGDWEPAYKKPFRRKSSVNVQFEIKNSKYELKKYLARGLTKLMVETKNESIRDVSYELSFSYNPEGKLTLISELPSEKDGFWLNETELLKFNKLIKSTPSHLVNYTKLEERKITLKVHFQKPKRKTTDQIGGVLFPGQLDYLPKFNNMRTYLSQNLINIQPPVKYKLQGKRFRFFVNFIVEKDGSLSDIRISRRFSDELGEAKTEQIINVFKNMPDWEPGIKNNSPVRVRTSQPIILQP